MVRPAVPETVVIIHAHRHLMQIQGNAKASPGISGEKSAEKHFLNTAATAPEVPGRQAITHCAAGMTSFFKTFEEKDVVINCSYK